MDMTAQDARDRLLILLLGGGLGSAVAGFVLAATWPNPGEGLGPGVLVVLAALAVAAVVTLVGAVGYAVCLGIRASGRFEAVPSHPVGPRDRR